MFHITNNRSRSFVKMYVTGSKGVGKTAPIGQFNERPFITDLENDNWNRELDVRLQAMELEMKTYLP